MTKNENPLKGLRCLGLCRASSDPQTKDSYAQQTDVLQSGCLEREMIWVGVEEETTSGSEPGNRDDLDRLLERKRNFDDYDVLLLQDRSRLTRAGQEHGAWLKVEFGRHGVRIVSMTSKMGNGRYGWVEEGMEDEASLDYVKKSSHNSSRGIQAKIEDDILAHCLRPPLGIDRLYLTPEHKPICIIRNLQDGRQQRLDPKSKIVLETYPKEIKKTAKRHFRKQQTDEIVLIPGAEEAIEMVRFIMEKYYVHGFGYKRIVKLLKEKGWLSATGRPWSTGSVEQTVHLAIYSGHGICNMMATGKFNLRDRNHPREVDYDLYKMMGQKRPKVTYRHPDDWLIKEYPQLFCILGDGLREQVWKRQYEFLVKRATGQLGAPRRDKHALSKYFLKHVIRCKATGKGLTGKKGHGNHRYYVLASFFNGAEHQDLGRHVPAEPIEHTAKSILRETLASASDLEPMIRRIVESEAALQRCGAVEIETLEAEQRCVNDQLQFSVANLRELGEDAVTKINKPLKDQRRSLELRLVELRARKKRQVVDVEKTIETILSELGDLSSRIEGMPPQVLKNVLSSFMTITIDLKDGMAAFNVQLPSWAIHRAAQIRDAVGVLDPCAATTVKEANSPDKILASYNCLIGREKQGAHYKPCIKCSRKAA